MDAPGELGQAVRLGHGDNAQHGQAYRAQTEADHRRDGRLSGLCPEIRRKNQIARPKKHRK